MNLFNWLMESFGIAKMPWVIRVYLLLFVIVLGVLIYSATNIPTEFIENAKYPLQRLFEFSLDLLKIIVGALLGSLSLAASHFWSKPEKPMIGDKEPELTE